MKKLNLGCGTDIRKGFINLDIVKLPGVDVVWDVNTTPYPFENESIDYVLCNDILEHVALSDTLKEIHRILTRSGVAEIRSPHFTSKNNFIDPTHINRFSIETLDFFISSHERNYYFDYSYTKVVSRKIVFSMLFKPIELLVNISNRTRRIYESYFCYTFPAVNIIVKLQK